MRRSGRLFEIIQMLRQARTPLPAHAIAARLEVSTRTVYRDVASLQAARVPIAGEAGVGYVLRPGYDLPPLMFTADEVEAIAVGLALLGRTGDGGLERAATRVRGKLAAVLPPSVAIGAVPLAASGWTAVPRAGADAELIRAAIRDEAELGFGYEDAAGRATARVVRPLFLTYWVENTVLGAWCGMRGAYRHFRIDRMSACARTGVGFAGQGARLRDAWQAAQRTTPPVTNP